MFAPLTTVDVTAVVNYPAVASPQVDDGDALGSPAGTRLLVEWSVQLENAAGDAVVLISDVGGAAGRDILRLASTSQTFKTFVDTATKLWVKKVSGTGTVKVHFSAQRASNAYPTIAAVLASAILQPQNAIPLVDAKGQLVTDPFLLYKFNGLAVGDVDGGGLPGLFMGGAADGFSFVDIIGAGTAGSGLFVDGILQVTRNPQVLAAPTQIDPTKSSRIDVSSAGAIVLSGTPTILPSLTVGGDGQILLIQNIGAFNITFQDETSLAGSHLRLLGAANKVLAPKGSMLLHQSTFEGGNSFWYQLL